jgi:hypothetical protein
MGATHPGGCNGRDSRGARGRPPPSGPPRGPSAARGGSPQTFKGLGNRTGSPSLEKEEDGMPGKLTLEEMRAYLDSRPGWITLTTIGRDGYPHSVPIGYFRLGDEVYVGGRAGTQKMKNAARNPKVTLLLDSGTTMRDIKGLMIQGDATVSPSRPRCCA